MIKYESVKIEKEEVVISDAYCDKCGKSCRRVTNGLPIFEYLKLEADWGYASNKDMESWRAILCEDCADEIAKLIKFQITQRFFDEGYFQ